MTYQQFVSRNNLTHAAVGRRIGKSRSYLTRVCHGDRPMTRALALKIWDSFGVKVEPIANATDAELKVLARFESEAA
jgi:plasmid maintenance system antidote protein VapI